MVPVMAPVDVFKESPDGSEPLVTAKTNGEIPPDVDKPEVTAPTVIPLIVVETMDNAAPLLDEIVPTKDRDWVCAEASVTVTVNV